MEMSSKTRHSVCLFMMNEYRRLVQVRTYDIIVRPRLVILRVTQWYKRYPSLSEEIGATCIWFSVLLNYL